jgi:DNA-directed RNA polymerase subunit RPC12/RpoP
MITKPVEKQFGMDGWEKHFEYFVTCTECNTEFLSNKRGQIRMNGEKYKSCPYCEVKHA